MPIRSSSHTPPGSSLSPPDVRRDNHSGTLCIIPISWHAAGFAHRCRWNGPHLQGDAPLTPPWVLEDLISGLQDAPDADIATPVLRCDGATLNSFLEDRKAGRVGGTTAVFDADRQALYFSKEVVPFISQNYADDSETPVYHLVGGYAYRADALAAYASWPEGPLELLEGLEQLRFLEQVRSILCVEVAARGRQFWELNNPEDVPRIEAMMLRMQMR